MAPAPFAAEARGRAGPTSTPESPSAFFHLRRRSAELLRVLASRIGRTLVFVPLLVPAYGLVAGYVLGITGWFTLMLVFLLTGLIVGEACAGSRSGRRHRRRSTTPRRR